MASSTEQYTICLVFVSESLVGDVMHIEMPDEVRVLEAQLTSRLVAQENPVAPESLMVWVRVIFRRTCRSR